MSGVRRKVDDDAMVWDFVDDPAIMECIEGQAERYGGMYEVDVDDVAQECVIWLAYRPSLQGLEPNVLRWYVRKPASDYCRKVDRVRKVETHLVEGDV